MEALLQDFKVANIYEASNDGYTKAKTYRRKEIAESPNHDFEFVRRTPLHYEITLDKEAEDYEKMYNHPLTFMAPDEILQLSNVGNMKIPLKTREEFPPDTQLPSSELLKVLHYYFSDKCSRELRNKSLFQKFDESALITLGLMVESWIDEAVDDNVMQMFLEKDDEGLGLEDLEVSDYSDGDRNMEGTDTMSPTPEEGQASNESSESSSSSDQSSDDE